MQLKKIALRGMIILAAVIALCILFSGTLRTLTTPKVRFASKKNGKIEQTIDLTANVAFPKEDMIRIGVPDGLSLTVTKIHAAVGEKVEKDAKLISTEVTDAESKLKTLQDEYDAARKALDEWNRKNGEIRLSRNENLWVEAYDAAREAEKKELDLRLSLMAELGVMDAKKLTEKAVSKAGEKTQQLYTEWQNAIKETETAQKKQADLDRYAVAEDIWTTLQTKRDAEKKQKDAENQMMNIRLLQKQAGVIRAPRAGYVIKFEVDKGTVLSGDADLFLFTKKDTEPVLRAKSNDLKKSIQKGTVISIPLKDDSRKHVDTKVVDTGLTDAGVPYIDAEITENVIREMGTVSAMLKETGIPMKLITRSQNSTLLIEAAAVRRDGEKRYVLVANPEESPLGEKVLKLVKREVTVLAENSDWVSVDSGVYSNDNIVFMEDRYIDEGYTVMQSN